MNHEKNNPSNFSNADSYGESICTRQFKASPVDKTVDIVAGKYPILILCADADEAVPPEENASLFEQKVKR